MSELPDYERREAEKGKAAEKANRALLEGLGVELVSAFNHGKTDPSVMATHGHDTSRGYEFFIDRGGRTAVVEVRWETLG